MNPSEVFFAWLRVFHEVMLIHATLRCKLLRHRTKHFHKESEVIVIFLMVISRSWIKQEVSGNKLENHASEGPHIGWRIIINSHNDLWGPILPRLNLWDEVEMRPAPITEIADFRIDTLVNHWAWNIDHLLLTQFNLSWILSFIFIVFLQVLWVNFPTLKFFLPLLKFFPHHYVLLDFVSEVPVKIEGVRSLLWPFIRIRAKAIIVERIVLGLLI